MMCSGCVTSLVDRLRPEHIVMVNDLGIPVNPQGNWFESAPDPSEPASDQSTSHTERWDTEGWHVPFLPYHSLAQEEYERYLKQLFAELEKHPPDPAMGKRKVMIFVHGGLNSARDSLERAGKLRTQMQNDGYYPIFVVWDSSLFSTFIDSLFLVRQGRLAYDRYPVTEWLMNSVESVMSPATTLEEDYSWLKKKKRYSWLPGILTSPPILIRDAVRGVVRGIWDTLLLRFGIILADWPSIRTREPATTRVLGKIMGPDDSQYDPRCARVGMTKRSKKLQCQYDRILRGEPDDNVTADEIFPIAEGKDQRAGYEKALNTLSLLAGSPLGLLSTMVIDFGGPGAWDMMLRRTALQFHTDMDFAATNPRMPAHGAIALLLARLQSYIKERSKREDWEITLVGHSMGTIVLNHMVRLYGDSFRADHLPMFDKIVYLAAACSLRDYQDAVFPYLKTYTKEDINNPRVEEPKVYHLMLHESADLQEQHYWELSRGSLLLWIDELFTNPQYQLDRVAGRYSNFIEAIHLTPGEVRSRISIKAANYGKKVKTTDPQHHGDFTAFPFWKEEFWTPVP